MNSDIRAEVVSAHTLSNDLRMACGWCDQNGHYDTDVVSVNVLRLRKWAEMAVRLEMVLKVVEAGGTDDRSCRGGWY